MKRRLIIFTYPGNKPEAVNAVVGAKRTILTYYRSPVGGAWTNNEIYDIDYSYGTNVKQSLMDIIKDTNSTCDYSVVVFVGHGASTGNSQDIIQISDRDVFWVNNLSNGLASPEEKARLRRTVIIDSCRRYIPETQLSGLLNESALNGNGQFSADLCRQLYNEAVLKQDPHVEIIQSTRINDLAHYIDQNTVFIDGVKKFVTDKLHIWEQFSMLPTGFIVPYFDVIEGVKPYIRLKQVPTINTTQDTSFPFFACIRPTSSDKSQKPIND